MEVTMMLCDFAEAINGKLYISGGGWSNWQISRPLDCAVAVIIGVPWNQANQKHTMLLELMGEDGQAALAPNGEPVKIEGEFETGRPPGVVPGDTLASPVAFRIQGAVLKKGGYKFSLKIDGTEVAATRFRVKVDMEMPS